MMAAPGPDDHAGAELVGESLEQWRSLGEAIPDILLVVSQQGTILYANRVPSPFALDAVVGSNVLDLAPTESRNELHASLAETFKTGRTGTRELPARHPDGTTRWYSAHTGPVRHGTRVVAAVIVARDITDRKAFEDALRESEERYRTLVERAPEAIVILDGDSCRFVDVNGNACELFGLPRERLIGSNPVDLSPPFQPSGEPSQIAALRLINEALDGGEPAFDWIHQTAAGAEVRCEVRLVRLPGKGRRHLRGSIIDVTRQRQLEAQLLQVQKLEALGQLAGGIAHDFNNILGVISMSAELLAADLGADSPCQPDVDAIRSAARRGTAFTSQLLAFARYQRPEHEGRDLNAVVEDVTAMLGHLLGPHVELRTRLEPGGACVHAGRGQLEQVLMNLLLNARDAMPNGGTITVSTFAMDTVHGPAILLSVEDTGTGMDDATRRRVFEPLFTTKGPEKGTGLGLSTVYLIVTQLGGHVIAESHPGVGSRFEVLLPTHPPS
jgi:PAS domain S-box-containing protein